jgi:protein-S-isoprenylcysteine O-methyltransferase Ste14
MIIYVSEVTIILLLFFIFGLIHTFLASNKVKQIIIKNAGNLIAFYRFFYVLFSLITFYLIYILAPNSHTIIYDLSYPYDFIVLVPQFLSIAGFIWTLKYFSVREFLGINQIIRWFHKNYNINDLDEQLTLRILGPYRVCRHPLYFFSIIFLLFRPEMDLSYLTFFFCIIAYFYIGSFYEEKKLVEKFGNNYKNYKNAVPRIFPYKFLYPYNPETGN